MDMAVNDLFADVERLLPENWAIDIYCIRGCLTVMLQDPLGGWRIMPPLGGWSIEDSIRDAVALARGISTMQQQKEGE